MSWATPMNCWPTWSRRDAAGQLQRVEHSFNPQDLISGKVEAMAIYTTNEPDTFDRLGFPTISTARARSASIFMATTCSRASRRLPTIRRACAFRAASLRGWQWAMSHQEETADLILNKYSRRADRQHLLYEARQMVPLVQPVLVEIGYMNPDRWQHIADVYAASACCPRTPASTALCTRRQRPPSLGGCTARWAWRRCCWCWARPSTSACSRASASGRWSHPQGRAALPHHVRSLAAGHRADRFDQLRIPRHQRATRKSSAAAQHELRALRWLEVGHPDDVVQIKAQMALLITQQISSFKALSRLFRPDGSVAWIDVSVTAIDTEAAAIRTTCA
jgi:hypothetical protein